MYLVAFSDTDETLDYSVNSDLIKTFFFLFLNFYNFIDKTKFSASKVSNLKS